MRSENGDTDSPCWYRIHLSRLCGTKGKAFCSVPRPQFCMSRRSNHCGCYGEWTHLVGARMEGLIRLTAVESTVFSGVKVYARHFIQSCVKDSKTYPVQRAQYHSITFSHPASMPSSPLSSRMRPPIRLLRLSNVTPKSCKFVLLSVTCARHTHIRTHNPLRITGVSCFPLQLARPPSS